MLLIHTRELQPNSATLEQLNVQNNDLLQIRKKIGQQQQQQQQQFAQNPFMFPQASPTTPMQFQNDPFPGIDMSKATASQAQQYFKNNPYILQQIVSR